MKHGLRLRAEASGRKETSLPDLHRQLRAAMAALIDGTYGCYDAAAATMAARWGGPVAPSTLSRKMTGSLDWTVADVVALEDAAGRYPVTTILARRLAADAGAAAPLSLVCQAGLISREAGEAVAAIIQADQSAGADAGADAGAEALVQVDEALEALRQARAKLEARREPPRAVAQ
jgi:hypothetical protein